MRTADLNALSLFVLTLTPQNESRAASHARFRHAGRRGLSERTIATRATRSTASAPRSGPALDGVGLRHDRAWLEKHFADPAGVSKGSIMPPYKFMPMDLDAICKYLLQLPKRA